MSNMKMFTPGL